MMIPSKLVSIGRGYPIEPGAGPGRMFGIARGYSWERGRPDTAGELPGGCAAAHVAPGFCPATPTGRSALHFPNRARRIRQQYRDARAPRNDPVLSRLSLLIHHQVNCPVVEVWRRLEPAG